MIIFFLGVSNNQLKIVENIIEVISLMTNSNFSHIQGVFEIILNDVVKDIELYNRLHPLLINCSLKYPEKSVVIFFQERHVKVCNFIKMKLKNLFK